MMPLKEILKTISTVTLCFFMMSCNAKPLDYVGLMRKPDILQKEFINCQGTNSSYCDLVKRAEHEFETLNTERQNNPELFGQRILVAQEELAKMTDKNSPVYAALHEKVDVMLAIVATTSPE